MSSGSNGHPFLCRSPCVHALYGSCMKGPRCEFCHLEHTRPKRKLSRQERLYLHRMPEVLALHLFRWHLHKHIRKLNLQQEFQLMIAVLERRLRLLRAEPAEAELKEATEEMWTLRGFSLGRLLDAVQLWPQFDTHFKRQVKLLADSARRSMKPDGP